MHVSIKRLSDCLSVKGVYIRKGSQLEKQSWVIEACDGKDGCRPFIASFRQGLPDWKYFKQGRVVIKMK